MTATVILWMVVGFVSGSLMFSYWLARLALRQDLRGVGDGNPGSTNVAKVGGAKWGLLAFLLDFLKGSIPVALARYGSGIYSFPEMTLIALAPVFGHAFSPFMRGRGGKAVAVTAGVWTAITLWEAPTLGGVALGVLYAFTPTSGWAILLMSLVMLAYYLITLPDAVLISLILVNLLLFAYKYRADLRHLPDLRGWVKRRIGRA